MDLRKTSRKAIAAGISAEKMYKGVLAAICLLVCFTTVVIADWKVIAGRKLSSS